MVLHPKIQALRAKVERRQTHVYVPQSAKFNALPIEQRAAKVGEDGRLIKQYFCIFGIPDDYGTVPIKGCFAKSIEERGPNSNANSKIKVLNQHNPLKPLCNPSVLKEDNIGLYGEYTPDEGIVENDDLVIRVKKGTIDNGSYGFDYVWDKMEYDEKNDLILMYETVLQEVSPVTFGSQRETFVVRSRDGKYYDEFLVDDTEEFLNQIPRNLRLTAKSLIDRHIALGRLQPDEEAQTPLNESKPKRASINYDYLINNLKF